MLDKYQTIIENQAHSHIKNQSNITQGDTQVDTWISRYVIEIFDSQKTTGLVFRGLKIRSLGLVMVFN
jgi:hypothetical protein